MTLLLKVGGPWECLPRPQLSPRPPAPTLPPPSGLTLHPRGTQVTRSQRLCSDACDRVSAAQLPRASSHHGDGPWETRAPLMADWPWDPRPRGAVLGQWLPCPPSPSSTHSWSSSPVKSLPCQSVHGHHGYLSTSSCVYIFLKSSQHVPVGL